MELADRVPQIDRPNFPITNLIQTIPRLLFKPEDLGIQNGTMGKRVNNRVQMWASTAVYLNSCAQYAYITGALVYEDLALIHQAKGDMEYHKMEKDKEGDKVSDEEMQRVGTESTKDKTMTLHSEAQNTNNTLNSKSTVKNTQKLILEKQTLSEVSEEEHGVSSRGNTFNSKPESSITPKNIQEEDKFDHIEGSLSDDSDLSPFKGMVRHSTLNPQNTLNCLQNTNELDILNSHIKKSEIIGKSPIPKNKIKLPKILVLISKYPIYKDLEQFLTKIINHCMDNTSIPIERMITNLIYEFPHPGFKYIIKSKYWGTKECYKFKYETVDSLPYCEPKHFLELSRFYENSLVIWDVMERVLFEDPVILVSKSIDSLISWSEILK